MSLELVTGKGREGKTVFVVQTSNQEKFKQCITNQENIIKGKPVFVMKTSNQENFLIQFLYIGLA